jgi:hypothetical protein
MQITPLTLNLRALPVAGEPLYGYVGRLARLHGKASIRAFLKDYAPEVPETQVWRGEAQGAIAGLVDLPEDVFAASTFAPSANGGWAVNGEAVGARDWSYKTPRLCPHCLAKDRQTLEGRPDFRAHLRSWWGLDDVRACGVHAVELVDAFDPANASAMEPRLNAMLAADGGDLSAPLANPADEDEVALASYLSVRLAYGGLIPEREPELLRAMPLGLALQACQVVGALSASPPPSRRGAFGLRPEPLDRHGLRRAGFALFRAGPEALARALDGRLHGLAAQGPLPSPIEAYGPLYAWLAARQSDPAVEELLEFFQTQALEKTRVSERQVLLRGKTEDRGRLSLRQVAQRLGAPIAKVRQIDARLRAMTNLPRRVYATPDDVLDDAVVAHIALALREALSAAQARALLAIDPALMKRLSAARAIEPFAGHGRAAIYLEARLKPLIEARAGDASLVEFAAADQVLLTKTALLDPPFPVAGAIRLLREGTIKARGRLRTTRGLPGIVLGVQDLESQRTRPRLPDAGSTKVVGFDRLAERLGCRLQVAKQLANAGAIRAQITFKGETGRQTPVFDPPAIEAFERDFVVIDELDRRLPQSRKAILALLQRQGVARQGPKGVPAPAYFARAAAEAALGLTIASPKPAPRRGERAA